MSEELKSWTSDRSGNPVDVGGRVPIRSGTTLHGFDAPGATVPDEVRINGEVFVRKSSSQARLSEAVKVLEGVLNEQTDPLHVGYDNASGGGNYIYVDAIRVDSDAFVVAKAFLATLGEDT